MPCRQGSMNPRLLHPHPHLAGWVAATADVAALLGCAHVVPCNAIATSAALHIIAMPPPPFSSSSTLSAPHHYPKSHVSPPASLRHQFGILVQPLHQESHQHSLGSAHSSYSTSSFSAHQLSSVQESLWIFAVSLLRFCRLSCLCLCHENYKVLVFVALFVYFLAICKGRVLKK